MRSLPENAVHVWVFDLDRTAGDLEGLAATLSAPERARAGRLLFPADRRRFVLRRAMTRAVLGRYTGIDPARLQFRRSAHGKPELAGVTIRFSCSHSRDLAVLALTGDRPIGVDVEFVRPVEELLAVAAWFFSDDEHATLRRLRGHRRYDAFFDVWTRKEALLKARGDGLGGVGGPRAITISEQTARWSIAPLSVADGYAAAVAVEGHDSWVECRSW